MAQRKIRQALRRAAATTIKQQKEKQNKRMSPAAAAGLDFGLMPLESRTLMSVSAPQQDIDGVDAYGEWDALPVMVDVNAAQGGNGGGIVVTNGSSPLTA